MTSPPPATTDWVPLWGGSGAVGAFFGYVSGTIAYASGNSIMPCDTKSFDTNGWLDIVTNKGRYTPKQPGYYRLGGSVYMFNLPAATEIAMHLYKNGSLLHTLAYVPTIATAGRDARVNSSVVVYANGTTDYFELWGYQSTAGAVSGYGGVSYNFFCGEQVMSYTQLVPPVPATTLPSTPYDGQEAILTDSTTNPSYTWRFRYNASSSSAYKWEFVGGAPTLVEIAALESTASGTYTDLTTVGPSFVVPRAGDYWISFGVADLRPAAVTGQGANIAPKLGSTAANDNNRILAYPPSATSQMILSESREFVRTLAASDEIRMQYRVDGSSASFANRWLRVMPKRVS